MADINVAIDGLASEIVLAVQQYTDAVTVAIEREIDDTSKAVLQEVEARSPVRKGVYKRGWRRKRESVIGGHVKYTIHNKSRPGLVHLLEKGHAKRGGGRVAGRPHLVPAYEAHVPAMEDRIKTIIRRGG